MWNVNSKCDAGNNWSDWNLSNSSRKYLSNIPGNDEVMELQKTAIFGTAHMLL
jgi:hypothetical protein